MTDDTKPPKRGPYYGFQTFEELVAARPDIFEEDFDCRPPSESRTSQDYSDSYIPQHMRERVLACRREIAAKAAKR